MQFIEGFVMTLHMCMNLIESAAKAPPCLSRLPQWVYRACH